MHLRELLQDITTEPVADVTVSGIACHSKQVRSGDVFVAMEGAVADGHAFLHEAASRGAAAIVVQRRPAPAAPRPPAGSGPPPAACPVIVVPDTRSAAVAMAARFYGHPLRKLRLIGVTGTNGKTTTTFLLQTILEAAGQRAGLLGTIAYHIGRRVLPSTNTTPGPLELQRYFAQMVGQGLSWCAMEVSSHALAQGRIEGLEFEAAIFSNLGSDHLDYHKTREAYAAAKRRLFDHLKPSGYAVVNMDDEYGRILSESLPHRPLLTYGVEQPAKVTVDRLQCSWQGLELMLRTPWGVVPVTTPLLGRHNASNIAAAAAALLPLGISPGAIREGLAGIRQVPGRLERVPNDAGVHVLIDYAHTADALRLALLSLRELTRGRVIVVFGCGGNRDHTKRPVMGQAASRLADVVLLTSDNPRGEEPLDIIRQIQAGFPPGFTQSETIADREQAILAALGLARRDDAVLIAGKGHEAYQTFDHVSVPFSDREVVERWFSSRHAVAVG
ncbi:MAG: UDP-N-acetylmuramoyl-L-alanyl-D-glutamate--2,6-diaminopimelate ligase [Candidatus Omnitrophica bacterium]|nr:UDP-N-acetylmuramoyl-L-alanyl-D-glutamate--2,6-diaminopimelate ligase [Candidatus Omnitrophota bacterium]